MAHPFHRVESRKEQTPNTISSGGSNGVDQLLVVCDQIRWRPLAVVTPYGPDWWNNQG